MSILFSLLILVSPAQALASTGEEAFLSTSELSGAAVQDGRLDLSPTTQLSTDPMTLQVGPNLSLEQQLVEDRVQALSIRAEATTSWDLAHQAMGLGFHYERATAHGAWHLSASIDPLDTAQSRALVGFGAVSLTHRW